MPVGWQLFTVTGRGGEKEKERERERERALGVLLTNAIDEHVMP